MGSIVLLFSAFQIFAKEDLLSIKGGYTALWLSVLYIIGAYLKKYNTLYRLKKRWLLLSYSLCVFISYGYKFIMEISHLVLQEPFKYLSDSNRLISYSSPTILLCGISLLLVFSKIQINFRFPSTVKWASSVSPVHKRTVIPSKMKTWVPGHINKSMNVKPAGRSCVCSMWH